MLTRYRPRILQHISELITPLGPLPAVLDFGSGDGYFASAIGKLPSIGTVSAVDVVQRPQSLIQPTLYNGTTLPFDDRKFELCYAVDVLHHCTDPLAAIDEMARCSKRFLLIKDHTQNGRLDNFALAVMDELGNRRFGIPSTYRYQQRWRWCEHIESKGWVRRSLQAALPCHSGLLGWATNRLQFVALWERADTAV